MKYFLTYILLFFSVFASAQNIEDIFCNINADDLQWIDQTTRKKMIQNHKTQGRDTLLNAFGKDVELEIYDEENNFLKIRTSKMGTVEIKTFGTSDNSYIVAVCFTACAPICDSHITFYNSKLELINNEMFATNSITNFIDTKKLFGDEKNAKKLAKITIIFNEIHITQNEEKIILSHDFETLLDKDIYAEIKPYLLGNTMDFIWDKTIFKPQNAYWK